MSNAKATRPHPSVNQTGQPLQAAPCACPEPVGDPREGTCLLCGHQVAGIPMPSSRSHRALGDHSTSARKVHRGGPESGLRAR